MKKNPTENVRIKITFISITTLASFLVAINFIPIFVVNAGIITDFTGDLYLDREAYVNQSNPDMSYFDSLWGNAVIGNSCETFVHFNLNLLPEETEELYFIIERYDLGPLYWLSIEDVEINLILIESNWNLTEITWNNKPKHEEIINTVNASEIRQDYFIEYYDLEKAINLTEIFEESELTEINFCINITEYNEELNSSVYLYGIKLIWNYEKLLISYTTIFTSVIIFSMLIGTLFYLRKDIFSCPNCNTKRKVTEKFCFSCKKSIEKEIIIKSSDYQLILTILWVFAFFEVSFLILTVLSIFYDYFLPVIIFFILALWVIFSSIQILKKIQIYVKLNRSLRKS